MTQFRTLYPQHWHADVPVLNGIFIPKGATNLKCVLLGLSSHIVPQLSLCELQCVFDMHVISFIIFSSFFQYRHWDNWQPFCTNAIRNTKPITICLMLHFQSLSNDWKSMNWQARHHNYPTQWEHWHSFAHKNVDHNK